MTSKPAIALVVFIFFAQSPAAWADDPTVNNPQPWRCEDSVVTRVGNYFENNPSSGYYAEFQSKLGVEQFPDAVARVVDRSAGSDSPLAKQMVTDKVQICLIYTPAQDEFCNPEQDPRGRIFRVYNYRLKAEYTGTNANHGCGGA